MSQKRTQILNKQAMRMSKLDQEQAQEQQAIQQGAVLDWELQSAHAKLDCKIRHGKVRGRTHVSPVIDD